MEDNAAPSSSSSPPASSSATNPHPPQTTKPTGITATTTATTIPPLDLESCTPAELSAHLLTRRFGGGADGAVGAAAFFLECAASLPDSGAISDAFLGGGGGGGLTAEQNGDAPVVATGGVVPVISPTTPSGPGGRTASAGAEDAALLRRLGEPLGPSELAPVEVSCVTPRGKFLLRLYERGFTLTNPKKPDETSERIVVTADSLTSDRLAIVFPRPEKCSSRLKTTKRGKKPEELVRLLLVPLETFCEEGDAVRFRNKVLKQVCLPLPVGQRQPGDGEVAVADATPEETDWIDAFRTSLSGGDGGGDGPGSERRRTRVVAIDYPQCRVGAGDDDDSNSRRGKGKGGGFVFRSDGPSTNPRMPFVGCYHGVNQGSLFPLEEGLLYFKPPLFLPRSDLRSIGCGRGSTGGGGSTSRFVDMHVTLHGRDEGIEEDDEDAHEAVEFTNISRDELNPLSSYIDNVLTPAMARDAHSPPSPGGGGREDEGPAEAEEETSTGDGTRRRSRREASAHAREATRAQLQAADAARRKKNPQEEEADDGGGNDDDDESEEGEEDYNVEDDMDSDEDEDHLIDDDDDDDDDDMDEDNVPGDNGGGHGEDDDDDDEDFDDKAMDDDETVSDDSGSDGESEDDPPKKKARKD